MSVVVDDLHPVPLADTGEASFDPTEVGQRPTDRLVGYSQLAGDGNGGCRIQRIVPARHGQRQFIDRVRDLARHDRGKAPRSAIVH